MTYLLVEIGCLLLESGDIRGQALVLLFQLVVFRGHLLQLSLLLVQFLFLFRLVRFSSGKVFVEMVVLLTELLDFVFLLLYLEISLLIFPECHIEFTLLQGQLVLKLVDLVL